MTPSTCRLPWSWNDLPDPTNEGAAGLCTVRFDQAGLSHIGDHLADEDEPWADLLPDDVVDTLRSLARQSRLAQADSQTLCRFLVGIEEHLRLSLIQPRLVLCRSRFDIDPNEEGRHAWEVILPCGALLVIREGRDGKRISTCYFPREVAHVWKSTRWWNLCEQRIRWYSEDAPGGLKRPPKTEKVVRVLHPDESPESRWQIQFITLEQWGFNTAVVGTPWQGRFPWWSNTPQQPPEKLLGPRRKIEEGE